MKQTRKQLRRCYYSASEGPSELGRTLAYFKVPEPEKKEVLGAFAAHKEEVTAGYRAQ